MLMSKWAWTRGLLGACLLFFAGWGHAYGPHDGLDCLGCHDPHYAKGKKIFKVKNTDMPNPRKPGEMVDGISALCLGCHQLQEFGGAGIKPIHPHMTHPLNVKPNPEIASVPQFLLRSETLQCVSCHDPHPSNPNWRYLRVSTGDGGQVGRFCMTCHASKGEAGFYNASVEPGNPNSYLGSIEVFTSFSEQDWGAKDPTAEGFEDVPITGHETPDYIESLGDYENSLLPAYQTAADKDFIYNPENIPESLQGGGVPTAPAEGGGE